MHNVMLDDSKSKNKSILFNPFTEEKLYDGLVYLIRTVKPATLEKIPIWFPLKWAA